MSEEKSVLPSYVAPYLGQEVKVKIDRPLHSKHPKYDFVYKANYGFVPNTKAPDGEEVDAYVLGVNEPLETFSGKCIAIIHRIDDDDDKLVVAPTGFAPTDNEILDAVNFQEKYFKSTVIRDTKE